MRLLKCLALFTLMPLFSFAWSGGAHLSGGAVTYFYLKKISPATIPKVLQILKHHPWYNDKRWTYQLQDLTGEDRDIGYFMLASIFPDDARDFPKLGGPPMTEWHYVYYPFVPAGQTVKATGPPSPNAEEKIIEFLAKVKTDTDSVQKAIDICWILNLIQEVHQPIYTISLFDEAHPQGDKGGALTYVRFNPTYPAQTLKSYWDGIIRGSISASPDYAQGLLADSTYQIEALPELKTDLTVNSWIKKESYVIAKEKVYMDGKVNGVQKAPSDVPGTYFPEAIQICERRLVLAGMRGAIELAKALQ